MSLPWLAVCYWITTSNNTHILSYTHTCSSLKLCNGNFFIHLAENSEVAQSEQTTESSESEQSTADDKDGDLSDVEERGYCADTSSVEINLKLARVTNPEIKDLLNNTDKVCVIMH